jgi:hypothetical protein
MHDLFPSIMFESDCSLCEALYCLKYLFESELFILYALQNVTICMLFVMMLAFWMTRLVIEVGWLPPGSHYFDVVN